MSWKPAQWYYNNLCYGEVKKYENHSLALWSWSTEGDSESWVWTDRGQIIQAHVTNACSTHWGRRWYSSWMSIIKLQEYDSGVSWQVCLLQVTCVSAYHMKPCWMPLAHVCFLDGGGTSTQRKQPIFVQTLVRSAASTAPTLAEERRARESTMKQKC